MSRPPSATQGIETTCPICGVPVRRWPSVIARMVGAPTCSHRCAGLLKTHEVPAWTISEREARRLAAAPGGLLPDRAQCEQAFAALGLVQGYALWWRLREMGLAI